MLKSLLRVMIWRAALKLTRLSPVSILQNCRGRDGIPHLENEWVLLEESVVVQNEM